MLRIHDEISIVLGGAAGQGIQTIGMLLLQVLKREGYHVFAAQEFMSRIRGGSNSAEIRVTAKKRFGYVRRIDLCLPLDKAALPHLEKRLDADTVILADKKVVDDTGHKIIDVPFSRIAQDFGNPLFASTVAVGAVLGVLGAELEGLEVYLKKIFARKGEEMVQKNIEAAARGYNAGKHVAYVEHLDIHLPRNEAVKNELLLSGTEAIGLGALTVGCNFLSSYPMSPGTGVLTFLSEQAGAFGLAVEQAEDEIAAINMALGAWYAGARAMVTTSGGGFALMEEGVSLAGIIETPVVIHIGMRPGPATGLPTRTEQADLNLALYSGHGEFPRVIFAPGTLAEAFEAAQLAFHLADKYQIPAFILSDQYLTDLTGTVAEEDLKRLAVENHVVKTKKDYQRYALNVNDGISPRGIPGHGEGLVIVDSDEHDEMGHLTEDLELRVKMMDKRMKKMEGLIAEALPPVLNGPEKAEIIIIGWGSTYGIIAEALEKSGRENIKSLHFKQVWPLSEDVKKYFRGVKKIIIIENNYTGQFANLLKLHGVKVTDNILKYNGEPFYVEELVEKLQKF